MSATSSLELLKAHAVISRSWLLAQVQKNKSLQAANQKYQTTFRSEHELIKWYDREDHTYFDVCADDHCQRYQGIIRSTTPLVEKAVKETHGEVLAIEGVICDARFSKCCGGVTEIFENVWEPVNHPYLQKIVDNDLLPEGYSLDLEKEDAANHWIMSSPAAFCNSSDKNVLKQVLNDYDQETNDFYRWKVVYSQEELSELIKTRTGIDFGKIIDLIPVERGGSARLIKLKIVGTLKTFTIGKELEIRKLLSKSHLYSSAFIIEKQEVAGKQNFILHGAGWGHGVGLCQIGAAVMGDKGYTYHEILLHYFRGAGLEHKY
jgi:SpoIID/LytB domain protein